MAKSTKQKKNRRRSRRRIFKKLGWLAKWENFRWILASFIVFSLIFGAYVTYLDFQIRTQFEGKRWSIPARVYARPLELYPDMRLTADQFENELKLLAYHEDKDPQRSGTYKREGSHFLIVTRSFQFWDGKEPSIPIRLDFVNNELVSLRHANEGVPLPLIRLDPAIVGRIYPSHTEDRVLVKLDEVPPLLVKALTIVEDRNFYEHYGVSPKSIMRAMVANIRAGATVQGGSTLTQQLVKNFFLTNKRSFWRKFNEAIMALLIEWHYKKDEIMQAYLNEIYLGQDGKRSIHGFGLASYFYFEKPIQNLELHQIALLVAMVKGASYYSPRRYSMRAVERRNLVLDIMADNNVISLGRGSDAKKRRLSVTQRAKSNVTSYPAFMDLVRRQLRRDYKEEDLNSEGLQIFTTLDPLIQNESEKALSRRLDQLGKTKDKPDDELQAASVVVSVAGGEVLSVIGGRNPRFAGFNRALDAVRHVGSLIKPVVYLSALEQPERYTLATLLDDGPISMTLKNGDVWEPLNFDHKFHDMVPLHTALAKSYNLSTARLGLEIGVPKVVNTLYRLGLHRKVKPYPSLLLGAVALSPMETAQVYHSIASGGFHTPLRAIREVLTAKGDPLQRYPLSVEKVVESEPMFLLNTAMQEVVTNGTGRAVYHVIPRDIQVAGKTGTSDDTRDSWFAGFTADKLGIVWVGRDNNDPTELTGSSGALRVWRDIFSSIDLRRGIALTPENIEMVSIDVETHLKADNGCNDVIELPFIKESAPFEFAPCADSLSGMINPNIPNVGGEQPAELPQKQKDSDSWFKGLFK